MRSGDVIVFTNRLRWTGKHLAGAEYASCTVITATPTVTESFCTGALSLNGLGEITLAGVVSLNQVGQTVHVAVTGGTGRYFGVRGDMRYRQGVASTVLHLHLTR